MGDHNLSDYRTTIEVLKDEFRAPLDKHAALGFLLRLAEYYRHELAYDLAEKCIEQFRKLIIDEGDMRTEHLKALAEFHARFGEYDRATSTLAIDGLSTDFSEFDGDRRGQLIDENKELDKLFKTSLSV